MSLCVLPPFSCFYPLPPSHTQHTVLLTISPIVCPSNDSQVYGRTALAWAIEYDGKGRAGCAECVALLRAAGAL